jgi:hypothetical protein
MVIKDNFLDETLINMLNGRILYFPMTYTGCSNDGESTTFFNRDFDMKDILTEYLCRKVQETVDWGVGFQRVYANIQFTDMPGNWHVDDGTDTFLLMTSRTLEKGVGTFELETGEKSDFIQNRLIRFNANVKHRGNPPNSNKDPRITITFKTERLSGNN